MQSKSKNNVTENFKLETRQGKCFVFWFWFLEVPTIQAQFGLSHLDSAQICTVGTWQGQPKLLQPGHHMTGLKTINKTWWQSCGQHKHSAQTVVTQCNELPNPKDSIIILRLFHIQQWKTWAPPLFLHWLPSVKPSQQFLVHVHLCNALCAWDWCPNSWVKFPKPVASQLNGILGSVHAESWIDMSLLQRVENHWVRLVPASPHQPEDRSFLNCVIPKCSCKFTIASPGTIVEFFWKSQWKSCCISALICLIFINILCLSLWAAKPLTWLIYWSKEEQLECFQACAWICSSHWETKGHECHSECLLPIWLGNTREQSWSVHCFIVTTLIGNRCCYLEDEFKVWIRLRPLAFVEE